MNAPRADRVAAIATELGLLGRRLDALATELSAWQPPVAPRPGGPGIDAPQPAPTVAAPPQPAWYGTVPGTPWPATPGVAWPAAPAGPVAPPNPGGHYPDTRQPFPPAPLPPPAPRRPLRAWLASLSGARLLAWTGAGVTLLGVVLLLALAAARGWFAPPVRVAAGAVLGLALVGLGARLHRRPARAPGPSPSPAPGSRPSTSSSPRRPRSTATCPSRPGCSWRCSSPPVGSRWPTGGRRYCSAAVRSSGRRCSRRSSRSNSARCSSVSSWCFRSRPPSWRCAGGGRCSWGSPRAGRFCTARWSPGSPSAPTGGGAPRPRSPCCSWASRRRRGPSGRSRCRVGCGSAWWWPRRCRR